MSLPLRFCTTLGLSAALLLAGCDQASQPLERSTPSPSPSPSATPVAVVSPSRPGDRVTVHYHRRDGRYDGAEIWTWDAAGKHTPAQNSLSPNGRDDFGAVYAFDRASYGDSERVGFITRLGRNWDHKDGGDKFWNPALGNDVWLLEGRNDVFTARPATRKVESATVDGPAMVTVVLTDAAPAPAAVSILDAQGTAHAVRLAESTSAADPSRLVVAPQDGLDLSRGQYRVQVDGFGPAVPLVPRGILDDRNLFFDGSAKLGASYTPQTTAFDLFAPTATSVRLVLYDEATGGKGRTERTLAPRSKGVWTGVVSGDLQGKFYTYLVDEPGLNPPREVLDPYATDAVASSTRARITPPLPPVHAGPRTASPTDMVVYETHVRDFTVDPNSGVQNRGRYLGFTETGTHLPDDPAIRTALDHLSELGVTHVELLPVQDFADDEAHPRYNWGYIPTAYFSPEGMYATRPDDDSRTREFRALVDALHARGIGVIMDVVYNHTAPRAAGASPPPGENNPPRPPRPTGAPTPHFPPPAH